MDCSPLGSSIHGILQIRILEGLPLPSPGDLPNARIKPTSELTDNSLPLSLLVLCLMSESLSGKREGLQDNATGKKGKFITDSSQGPLPHPTQGCRSESPEPKLLHKFIGWAHALGLSWLVTSLQSNFIGQNFHTGGTFLGVSAQFLIS